MKPAQVQKDLFSTSVPPSSRDELRDYLRTSASTLSVAQAMHDAVKLWIATDQARHLPAQGYQWKQLFLPAGARVRLQYAGAWHCADVEGDELVYQGRAVSPHQMTLQTAGDGRNAWRELWIRFPGEQDWTNAGVLRARLHKQAAAQPASPAEAMAAAARAMGDALTTALTLVEHANHQAQNTLERRLPRYRRECDLLEDIH